MADPVVERAVRLTERRGVVLAMAGRARRGQGLGHPVKVSVDSRRRGLRELQARLDLAAAANPAQAVMGGVVPLVSRAAREARVDLVSQILGPIMILSVAADQVEDKAPESLEYLASAATAALELAATLAPGPAVREPPAPGSQGEARALHKAMEYLAAMGVVAMPTPRSRIRGRADPALLGAVGLMENLAKDFLAAVDPAYRPAWSNPSLG